MGPGQPGRSPEALRAEGTGRIKEAREGGRWLPPGPKRLRETDTDNPSVGQEGKKQPQIPQKRILLSLSVPGDLAGAQGHEEGIGEDRG